MDTLQKSRASETAIPQRSTSYLPAIIAFLAVLTATLLIASTYPVFNQTYDEGQHLAAGMEWLDRGSYSYETLTPPLARVAVALGPYLDGARDHNARNAWADGNAILEYEGHYQRTLTLARLGILPFFWLCCFVLWSFMSGQYGQWPAALGVLLFAFCPPVLAHASLATADLALTAMFLCALISFWKFLQQPGPWSAALAGLTAALAVLCKLSAVPYLGFSCGALLLYSLIEKRRVPSWKYLAIGVVIAALTIWAGYRFSVGPILEIGKLTPLEVAHLSKLPGWIARLFFVEGFPAPEFFKGLAKAFGLAEGGELGYMFGKTYIGGRWYFFPVAIAVKTPIPFLLLAAVGIARALAHPRLRKAVLPLIGVAAPLFVAVTSNTNLGLRYILVIYPFVAMFGGCALFWLWQAGNSRNQMLASRSIAAVLVVWTIVTCVRATPDFIPYLNEIAAPYGSRILVDSDYDWGQDLNRLALVAQQQNIHPLWIAYEGSADVSRRGSAAWQSLAPNQKPAGWIAISEYVIKTAPQDFGWLEAYKPERVVGKTIRLYHFEVAP